MPAKSFFRRMREAANHFNATVLHHEISEAEIAGYLRAAAQLAQIWQQIDASLAALLTDGVAPWDAYYRLRYPLAFIHAARVYQVFVQELIAADAALHPGLAGYLPQVTYDQANALCHHIYPVMHEAMVALNDATYVPTRLVPMPLEPRIQASDGEYPLAHLYGMLNATREVRAWTAGLIAEYQQKIEHGALPIPPPVQAQCKSLSTRLIEADAQVQFAEDLVGHLTADEATPTLRAQAEENLWQALDAYFTLNQIVAMPILPPAPVSDAAQPRKKHQFHDRRIQPDDLWVIATPSARVELRGTPFGRDEMNELCMQMGGMLTASAQAYLQAVQAATDRGDIIKVGAMAACPFEPLYRSRIALDIAGAHVPSHHEFHWNYHHGHIESVKRFGRVSRWQECEE